MRWGVEKIGSNVFIKLTTTKPEWSPQHRGRVLLWGEQGLGDQIMFLSLVPDFIDYIDELIIKTDKRLFPLLKRTLGDKNIRYIDKKQQIDEANYDFHIAMGSLPKYLRSSLKSFQDAKQFILKVDQNQSDQIRHQLLDDQFDKIIGISWKSYSTSLKNKSLSLEQFVLGINSPKIKFVCLQYGEVTEEIKHLKTKYGIEISEMAEIDKFNDIDSLSALIKACDEVISIGNITVPLTGALGCNCKALMIKNNSWWWGNNDTHSYWYSSIKLFRQTENGEWNQPLKQIKEEIKLIDSDS